MVFSAPQNESGIGWKMQMTKSRSSASIEGNYHSDGKVLEQLKIYPYGKKWQF